MQNFKEKKLKEFDERFVGSHGFILGEEEDALAFLSTAIDEAYEAARAEAEEILPQFTNEIEQRAIAAYRDQLVKKIESMRRLVSDRDREEMPEAWHEDISYNQAILNILGVLRPEQSDSKPGT